MNLSNSNCSVNKETGAVLIHKSPELQEILRLKNDVKSINGKLDEILELLKGGHKNGQEMENPGQCQNDD